MPEQIFFNTSFPRAGSTLLQNIIGQNPDFYVTPTSDIQGLLVYARRSFSTSEIFKAQDTKTMDDGFKSFCKTGLFGWFNGITDKKYVLDKNRTWGISYDFVDWFYPNPKMICLVRDLRSIYASYEKFYRKNLYVDYDITQWEGFKNNTTDDRLKFHMQQNPIGTHITRTYDTLIQGKANQILFLKFEDLLTHPQEILNRIYDYLEIPRFNHTFTRIDQITHENDRVLGYGADHTIKNKLEPLKEDYLEVLGPDNCKFITESYPWFYEYFDYKI
jgi:sulfotransferase